jgi:hypothetical protein
LLSWRIAQLRQFFATEEDRRLNAGLFFEKTAPIRQYQREPLENLPKTQ